MQGDETAFAGQLPVRGFGWFGHAIGTSVKVSAETRRQRILADKSVSMHLEDLSVTLTLLSTHRRLSTGKMITLKVHAACQSPLQPIPTKMFVSTDMITMEMATVMTAGTTLPAQAGVSS